MKERIAFYPFVSSNNEYIVIIRNMLRERYELVDYEDLKNGILDIKYISAIYLNWIENVFDTSDKIILEEAKKNNIRIIWVFHNKIPHDSTDVEKKEELMLYLMGISDTILIHSRSSLTYLEKSLPGLETQKKVFYVPHMNYCGKYYRYGGNVREKNGIGEEKFVFGFIGALKAYKNIELLMEAFQEVSIPNSVLFIVGYAEDALYYKTLEDCAKKYTNVVIKNEYIFNAEMGSYLDAIDVMVLPYVGDSSLNSGAMMMAFSYQTPVIIPKISMAQDFPETLFYPYDLERDAKESVKQNLLAAFSKGKAENRKLGESLEKLMQSFYSGKNVEKTLLEILEKQVKRPEPNYKTDEHLIEAYVAAKYKALILDHTLYTACIWLELGDKNTARFFLDHEIHHVAVYGYGKLGRRLIKVLQETGITVDYIVDRNKNVTKNLPVYGIDDCLPATQAIIVTVGDFENVKWELTKKSSIDVIDLKEIMEIIQRNRKYERDRI